MTATLHTVPGNPDLWWEDGALRAIEHLAATVTSFTAYDLIGLVDEPDHSCRWGSVFAKAKALGIIQRIGYTSSRRPGRSSGVCGVWAATPKGI